MNQAEALAIVDRILRGEAIIVRTAHFLNRLEARGYTMLDVRKVLRSRRLEGR